MKIIIDYDEYCDRLYELEDCGEDIFDYDIFVIKQEKDK